MPTISYYSVTDDDLQQYMNIAISLAAEAAAQDGLVSDPKEITDRYLAVIVKKGTAARMFEKLFGSDDKEGATKIHILRVENKKKKEENK